LGGVHIFLSLFRGCFSTLLLESTRLSETLHSTHIFILCIATFSSLLPSTRLIYFPLQLQPLLYEPVETGDSRLQIWNHAEGKSL
jgi:hypothetical protein